MGDNFSEIYNFIREMDENKAYHDLCPLNTYDSSSLSPELVGHSYGNYDFSKFLNDIGHNEDEGVVNNVKQPSDSKAFNQILTDSEYPKSQTLYYNGNYITDSCVESTDILKNSNSCDTYKKRERRKTCKFLNFSRKKHVSYSHCNKPKKSTQSPNESKYSSAQTGEQMNKSDSISNTSFPDQCDKTLEYIASSTCIDIPINMNENLPSATHLLLQDSLSTNLISDSPLNTDNDKPILNLPTPSANVITIPVIDGKFTVDGGVFLSSSAVLTEPQYSGESDSFRYFECEGVNHEMQLIENDCNYDIIETSSPLDIGIDLESNNSCSSLLVIDESSKDFDHSSFSTSLAHSHPPVRDAESISVDHSSKLQTELRSDSAEMVISHTSTNQSNPSQTKLKSESNIMQIDPIPIGRKRRPRVSYETLTEEQKLQRIRIMNNDACLRYRTNKKKTIKELEKDIHDLETRNTNLHKIHEALKARKEKAEQLIADFLPGPTKQKSKGKSVKRKSTKQKR